MLELVGAILGGVVSGAVGGWVAGAKSAQRTLASSTDSISIHPDDPPSIEVASKNEDPASAIGMLSTIVDSTSSIDVVPADDDVPSLAPDFVPTGDRSPSVVGSNAESASESVTAQVIDPIEEASKPSAELSIQLDEVGLGYFDLLIVNSGEGEAHDANVEITKTGSGGYSYLPTGGDVRDLGRLQPVERRGIGQIVKTGGKGLLVIRTTWVQPDGSSGEDQFAFE